jgi:hypothetical protein
VILDGLRAGCDVGEGGHWTVGVDATVVRGHQHAAGARREPPRDIPAERLMPLLPDTSASPPPPSTAPDPAGVTGGWVQ